MEKLTRERVIGKIKRRLGGDFCDQLDGDDFEDALDYTDIWFLTWFGTIKEAVTQYGSGEREITVADDCSQVLEVNLSGRSTDYLAMIDPGTFSDARAIPATLFRPGRGGGVGDIYQMQNHIEMTARVFGAERDWEYVRSERKIRIYPMAVPASSGGYVHYSYVSKDIDYDAMTPSEQLYYLRWAEAEAKKVLGRIRSKYGNLPGPGDNVEIADGQTLLEEAKEEMMTIMEEVKQKPIGFIIG